MVERYTDVFSKYLKAFTRQDVKIMLGTTPVFLNIGAGTINVNRDHPLWKIPELDRLYRIIVRRFLELVEAEKLTEATPEKINKLIDIVDTEFESECFNNWFPHLPTTLICALANEKYEGRDSTGLQAVFCPHKIDYASVLADFVPVVVGKKKSLSFSEIHAQRKFLGLTNGQCLVYELKEDGCGNHVYELVGLADRDAAVAKLFGIHFLPHSVWAITQPDWMSRGTRSGLSYAAIFRDAHFCLPEFSLDELEEKWIQNKLAEFGKYDAKPVCSILAKAKKQSKGALIILTDSSRAQNLAQSLCQAEMAIEVGEGGDRPCLSGKYEHLDRFSSIDGAVLADFEGNCYAIGAILSGKPKGGDIGRGSRYNCTVSFLNSHRHEPYLAIVVSEDHIVNLLDSSLDLPRKKQLSSRKVKLSSPV